MGYPELLRVLEDEAAREARALREGASRDRERIVAEAAAAARGVREALLARVRAECDARRRAQEEAIGLDRARALLFERRRLLDGLREAILGRLAGAGGAALDERLLAEVLPEAGDGPLEVVVDPGADAAARAALARLAPAQAASATVRCAAARRGGVEVIAGRRVLDDTLPSRLERAWPDLEPELASILWGEG